jgi:acyl-coenzyme A synthetase/AMP-(fatty) acid ligase
LKVRGFQVAPAELEGHLLLHPDVVDACVVGVPHEYSGEVPKAYVVLDRRALDRIGSDSVRIQELKDAIAKVRSSEFRASGDNLILVCL